MAELAALDAEAAALGDPETRNVALTAQAEQLTRRETALTALAQSLTEDQRRTHAARQAQDAYRTAAAAQDAAHAERDACERAFLDAQAGLLAQGLAEGTPCPVCGSVHHPAKAALPHTAPTQAQVTAAKQAAEAADREAQDRAAAAREALAAQREGKATLRRDAESLLPERFTSPEGPVALTVACENGPCRGDCRAPDRTGREPRSPAKGRRRLCPPHPAGCRPQGQNGPAHCAGSSSGLCRTDCRCPRSHGCGAGTADHRSPAERTGQPRRGPADGRRPDGPAHCPAHRHGAG